MEAKLIHAKDELNKIVNTKVFVVGEIDRQIDRDRHNKNYFANKSSAPFQLERTANWSFE